jgi:hypothetical protein
MLILLYLTLVFQEEINIVKGIHKTVFLVAIDFKRLRMASSHICYRLVGLIHLNLGLWVGKHGLEKFLLELLAHDNRQNEAVEKVIDFLSNYYSMGMLYETLSNAQVQIMSLVRLCDRYIEDGQKWGEVLNPNDIEDMLLMVNDVYKLLKPFEDLARENCGGHVL